MRVYGATWRFDYLHRCWKLQVFWEDRGLRFTTMTDLDCRPPEYK